MTFKMLIFQWLFDFKNHRDSREHSKWKKWVLKDHFNSHSGSPFDSSFCSFDSLESFCSHFVSWKHFLTYGGWTMPLVIGHRFFFGDKSTLHCQQPCPRTRWLGLLLSLKVSQGCTTTNCSVSHSLSETRKRYLGIEPLLARWVTSFWPTSQTMWKTRMKSSLRMSMSMFQDNSLVHLHWWSQSRPKEPHRYPAKGLFDSRRSYWWVLTNSRKFVEFGLKGEIGWINKYIELTDKIAEMLL